MNLFRGTRRASAVWIAAAGLTLLSIVCHVSAPSTWRDAEAAWSARVAMHESTPVFAARPLTTGAVNYLHDIVGWEYRTASFAVLFVLQLICGPVLYRYLRRLGFEHRFAIGGMVVFYLSLPVLLAHFEPVHTWDDFWVYLFVPLALCLTLEGRLLAATVAMAGAIVARESSMLFVVPWVALLWGESLKRRERMAYAVAALVSAAALRWVMTGMGPGETNWELTARMHLLAFNFESFERGRDTVFSLLASLGVLWPVGLYGIFRGDTSGGRLPGWLRFGGIWSVVGFTVPTVWMMQARESRLFFPAFVFLLPAALHAVRVGEPSIRRVIGEWSRMAIGAGSAGLLTGGVVAAQLFFPDFEYRNWHDGNWVVFGVHIAAACGFVLLLWWGGDQGAISGGGNQREAQRAERADHPAQARAGYPTSR